MGKRRRNAKESANLIVRNSAKAKFKNFHKEGLTGGNLEQIVADHMKMKLQKKAHKTENILEE